MQQCYSQVLSLIILRLGPGDNLEHKLKFRTASSQRGRVRSTGEVGEVAIDDFLVSSESADKLRLLTPFSGLV